MNNKRIGTYASRTLALVLAMACLFLVAAPAMASSQTLVYATTPLNVRSGPGTNYSIVDALYTDQVVPKVGQSGNWALITINGRNAYVYNKYLRVYSGPSTPGGNTTIITPAKVNTHSNVYSGAGTHYNVIDILYRGDNVQIVSTSGEWAKIIRGSGYGYVSLKNLTLEGGNSGNVGTLMQATEPVNVRSGPGTNYTILTSLYTGQTVTKLDTTGNWTRILYQNGYAYVHSNYLKAASTSTPTPTPNPNPGGMTTMYATANVNVRSGPSTKYNVLTWLSTGQSVTKVDTTGNWTRILYQNGYAYVSSKYLSSTQPGGVVTPPVGQTTVYATANVNVRSGPSTKYSILGSLSIGQSITCTGYSGNWSQVVYNGKTAYVFTEYLSTKKPSGGGSSGSIVVTPASGTMYTAFDVTVRSGPSSSYSAIGTLRKNTVVTRTGISGDWTQIKFNSSVGEGWGFVRSSELNWSSSGSDSWGSDQNFTSTYEYLYTKNRAAVYSSPSSGLLLGYVAANDRVLCTGLNPYWARVNIFGNTGYIRVSDLRNTPGGSTGGSGSNPTVDQSAGWKTVRDYMTPVYKSTSESSSQLIGYFDRNADVYRYNSFLNWSYVYGTYWYFDFTGARKTKTGYGYVLSSTLK